MWLFHEVITTGRTISIAFILVGSLYYTWVRNQELIPKTRQTSGSPYSELKNDEKFKDVEQDAGRVRDSEE